MSRDATEIVEGRHFPMAVFLRATLAKLLLLAFRVRITGQDNVPSGGAVLAGNHVSYMDPIVLWCASPRRCRFMSKSELWEGGATAWGLPRLWSFPVARGEADRTAIQTATRFLEAGELVGIFPEGTRAGVDGTRGQAQGGVSFIAMRAGVPIVPVAFVGTEKVWPRGKRFPRLARVSIMYGEPLRPQDVAPDAGRKERVEAMTTELMRRIDALLMSAKGEEVR
jgi:1-acyl-sn-glycerol-3-phosphate acyltransferase